jgi:transposase
VRAKRACRVARSTASPRLRQLIVDLKAEYPPLHLCEIARICYVAEGRRPSPHSIQRVLADGPAPTRTGRRYPPYAEITDPAEARLAIIRLHAEGWRVSTIAAYLACSRQQVYRTLHRWIEEGAVGLDHKPRTRKRLALKTTMGAMHRVRELQRNPELGAFRVHAALKREGIILSPRRHRADGRRSPAEVLGWVHGRVRTAEELERLFRLRSGRVVDDSGYVRFRDWRLYGERGLVKKPATIWLCGETVTIEHDDEPLPQFTIHFAPDKKHFLNVDDPRLFETRFVSPQPFLWDMADVEWRLVRRARPYRVRRKRATLGVQPALFP